jgi:hypothetical protein
LWRPLRLHTRRLDEGVILVTETTTAASPQYGVLTDEAIQLRD